MPAMKGQSSSFSAAIQAVAAEALATFEQEIERQQLFYHGLAHIDGVLKRALLIFDTVVPFYEDAHEDAQYREKKNQQGEEQTQVPTVSWDRQRQLLYLCAIAHDMLQIFSPTTPPHTSRQRQSGHSEKATFELLLKFIEQSAIEQNQTEHSHLISSAPADPTTTADRFTAADIKIVKEAIEATICQYDPEDGSIYQPLLYQSHRDAKPLSLAARALALADIGTLGIEGIEAYTREGSLLLLEENLDIIAFLKNEVIFDDNLQESLRQRLLKRARFEVTFAKGRLNRLDQELAGLPPQAIVQLKQAVFQHLTPETIQTLEAITPTAEDTALTALLDYFQLSVVPGSRLF